MESRTWRLGRIGPEAEGAPGVVGAGLVGEPHVAASGTSVLVSELSPEAVCGNASIRGEGKTPVWQPTPEEAVVSAPVVRRAAGAMVGTPPGTGLGQTLGLGGVPRRRPVL